MKIFIKIVLFAAMLSFTSYSQSDKLVEIKTDVGNIKVELFGKRAPITVRNFLRYVKAKSFRNSGFYRTVTMANQPHNKIKIQVIQGGIEDTAKMFSPIRHESTKETGILHKNGVISMARNEPGSETSEFFICIGDQPSLDYGGMRNPDGQGFSAFGKVVMGMDVVRKIQQMHSVDQRLKPPVKINDIVLLNK